MTQDSRIIRPQPMAGATAADIAKIMRSIQEGEVIAETSGDLAGYRLHGGINIFRSTTAVVQDDHGCGARHTYSIPGIFGYREAAQVSTYGAVPPMHCRWQFVNNDNQRVFVGFSSQVLGSINAASDDPGAAYVALQQTVGASQFRLIHKATSGGTQTVVPTTINVADDVLYAMGLAYFSPTKAIFVMLDEDGEMVFDNTITTNLPAENLLCAPTWSIENTSGSAESIHYLMKSQTAPERFAA
jgi:hypothetical protein